MEDRIGKGFMHYPDYLLNYSAKYHEVDYKMGGYTKEWDWFKYTPIVAAAKNGHVECVRLLLLNGACPVTWYQSPNFHLLEVTNVATATLEHARCCSAVRSMMFARMPCRRQAARGATGLKSRIFKLRKYSWKTLCAAR